MKKLFLTGLFLMVAIFGLSVSLFSKKLQLMANAAVTDQPRIQQTDLVYQGSFKLPTGTLGTTWGFGSNTGCCGVGTYAVTYNPVRNSLFIGGHPYEQRIAEMAIPSSLAGSPTASALTNLIDPLEGKLGSINPSDPNAKVLSMSLVYKSKLYLGAYSYYDGAGTQTKSHFSRPLDLNTKGQVVGPVQVGSKYPGWVDKYASLIPSEWQSLFGGPALTGGAGGAINSLQSWGPSVSVFNPEDIGVKNPVPATLVVGYPYSTPLANTAIGNNYWSETDVISGTVFIPGTRSVLFFGRHGLGNYCYGTGGTSGDCYDPDDGSKGTHGYPYKSWVWAYDANDLIAVKNGQKQYYQVFPYAIWNLDSTFIEIQGVAYDPATQRLFISQVGGDGSQPLIRVYKVNAPASTFSPTPTPTASPIGSASPAPSPSTTPTPPPPAGNVINVATETQLRSAINNLTSGQTINIATGTYSLIDTLYIPQNIANVTIKGATGNRNDVVIRGNGMNGTIRFAFWGDNIDNFTFSDFTIRDIKEHGVILNGGADTPTFRNLRMVDVGDQFLKNNPGTGDGVDNGLVENCLFEYTTLAPDYYTNGIDVHTGENWIIRGNTFKNIKSSDALTGPVILMWNTSSGTIVERNTFMNNEREIAFGLDSTRSNDHLGGIIRNNFIYRPSGTGGDVAIGIFNSPNSKVLNNTIKLNGDYPNAVEYRFANTAGVEIKYNLTDAAIVSRDGGTGTVSNNITNAQNSWFVNSPAGDLHLTGIATAVINTATSHASVTNDFDGQARPVGSAPEIGADEYTSGATATLTPTPSPSSGPLACDLNKDTRTDILDFQLLVNVILGITPNPGGYDINKDGQVNVLDTQVLANVILGKSNCL